MSEREAPRAPIRYRTPRGVVEVAAGGYKRADRTWFRYDRYRSDDPSFVGSGLDHVFALDPSDVSPQHRGYDPRCSCCWLGFGHTVNYHSRARRQRQGR